MLKLPLPKQANPKGLSQSTASYKPSRKQKRFAVHDALVPSGSATDFSATVEVTYYILKSFRACPP